jgi:heterodisulfide reductase subunit A-like polyferredoxin/coenzyme F420-reducing hydrogenase delta subunit
MKIGLFLSRDNGTISQSVKLDALAREFSHLPAVRVVESFFTHADQVSIQKDIAEKGLDAVVLAGDSPEYFRKALGGAQFLDILEKCGINRNQIAFANVREHAAIAYAGDSAHATSKARLLIKVALAKVVMCPPMKSITVTPRKTVLVVGATPGSLVAASNLLRKDYRVILVERKPSLPAQSELDRSVQPIMSDILSRNKLTILLNSNVTDVSGWCGDYKVTITDANGSTDIAVGGIILGVGDDTDWLADLKPMLQLDTDDDGNILIEENSAAVGRTRDPGVCFIASDRTENRLLSECNGARAAVLTLTTLLDQGEILHSVRVSAVDENVCGGCATCVKTCAFSAAGMDLSRKLSIVDATRCKGCGNCVVACPTGARDLITFPSDYVIHAIDTLRDGVTGGNDSSILALVCSGAGYTAFDAAVALPASKERPAYPVNCLPLQVECGGSIDTQYVLHAFHKGFDGVALVICQDCHCHHVVGNTDMERRISVFREVLRSRNIDDERMRIVKVSHHDAEQLRDELAAFSKDLTAAGVAEEVR